MTTALYRRYRPDTFEAMIGQDHVTEPLKAALAKNKVNHAYLFSGPRGCGKTTSARILARCLNCAQGPTPTPCGECDSCRDLAQGGPGSIDVIEIDAASHGGVDDARDLRERATFAPARDRYKIFIIDEAHMVTSAGFNALLKIVEEPPEHIKFIFATTEPDKVIGTIRSRTHHYPFRLVPPETLQNYLATLCEQEGVTVEAGVLPLAIRAGAGSVRDTLSVLDQLIAGASDAGVTYERAVALLGYTHAALLDDVIEAFAAHDSAAIFRSVDRVIQTGQDPRRFVEDLLERFRDLIIVKAVPESASSILRGLSADQLERLAAQAGQLGPSELSRAADIVNAALTDMTGATSPRLHLELMCARLLLPAVDETQSSLAARLERVERRLDFDDVPAGSKPSSAPSSPSEAKTASAPAPSTAKTGAAAAREALKASMERISRGESTADEEIAQQNPNLPAEIPDWAPSASVTTPAPAAPAEPAPAQAAAPSQAPAPQQAPASSTGWPAVTTPGVRPGSGAQGESAAPAESGAQAEPADPEEPAPSLQELAAERAQEAAGSGTPAQPPRLQPTTTPPQEQSPQPAQQRPAPQQQSPRQPAPQQRSPQTPAPQAPAAQAPAPQVNEHTPRAPQPPSSKDRVDMLRRAWPDILEKLRGIRRATAILAQQSHVVDVTGNNVTVGFPAPGAERGFHEGHQSNLAQAINLALGVQVTITPIQHGGGSDAGPKAPAAPAAAPSTRPEPAAAAPSRPQQPSRPAAAPRPQAERPAPQQAPQRQQPPARPQAQRQPESAQRQPEVTRRQPQPSQPQAAQRSPWDAREPIPEESSYFEDPYAPTDMPESNAWESVPENVDYSFPDASTPFDADPEPQPVASEKSQERAAPQQAASSQTQPAQNQAPQNQPAPQQWLSPEELDAIPAPGDFFAGESSPAAAPAEPVQQPRPQAEPARLSSRDLSSRDLGPREMAAAPQPPSAPAVASDPAPSPAPAEDSAAEETAPGASPSSPGNRSRFHRLVAAQEAKAMKIAERWKSEAAAAAEKSAPTEFVPSDEDEMLEQSSVHGRAAIERILGGRLEEERAIDGMG